MVNKNIIKKFWKIFAIYGVQIWLILFVANVGFITFIRLKTSAQSCLSQDQINVDSRCLYILAGKIYSQGTRNNPHNGHACGMDVTSIIPSFHTNDINKYLLPNYVGPLCSNTPTPLPTANPTEAPTQPPAIAPTTAPTSVPTQPPSNATQNPSAANSPSPVSIKSPTPKPTTSNTISNQTTTPISKSPTPTPGNMGNFGSKDKPVSSPAPIGSYYLYYWSTIFSYISFVILFGTGIYWLIQKIKLKRIEVQKNI